MASGDEKTTQFTTSLSNCLLDLLDWLCAEQETPTTRSQMLALCLERELHRYCVESRPDLLVQTSVVRKQRFYRELREAILKGQN